MRVLHITNALPSPDFPGYGVFIQEQIVSLKDPDLMDILFINGRKYGKFAYLMGFFQILFRAGKYDVLHCHHIYIAVLAGLAAPHKKKVVSFLSDEFNLSTRGWMRRLYRFAVRSSDARIYKKAVPPDLLRDPDTLYLPNGVDMDFFHPASKVEACAKIHLDPAFRYLLFVSSNDLYRPEKRFALFEKAVQILQQKPEFADVKILSLVKAAREFVPAYFNASEMHVLTSLYEGSPNSVKESMACNVPVVSTPVGNVRDLLDGSFSCRIIEDESPEKIAEEIITVLNLSESEDLRALLKKKQLDMDSVAVKLKALYRKISA